MALCNLSNCPKKKNSHGLIAHILTIPSDTWYLSQAQVLCLGLWEESSNVFVSVAIYTLIIHGFQTLHWLVGDTKSVAGNNWFHLVHSWELFMLAIAFFVVKYCFVIYWEGVRHNALKWRLLLFAETFQDLKLELEHKYM